MDKYVTLKFYRVEQGRGAREPFSEILERLQAVDEANRERIFEDVPFWIDKLVEDQGIWCGRFCRKQSSNLPPKALAGTNLVPLGVGSIGQTAAWRYHAGLSVLVFEANRGGVGLPQFFRYVRSTCECRGYAGVPVVGIEELGKLRNGRIRGLNIRLASPRDLQHVSAEQTAVATGLDTLMGTNIATQIEVRYSLRTGDPDMAPSKVSSIVRFLRGEKAAERGDIKKIEADVIDEAGEQQTLDFLEAHMTVRQELDLPDDDPDMNHPRRVAFAKTSLRAKLGELQELFGDE